MKLITTVGVVLLLENDSDQQQWENFSMSQKLQKLKSLGVVDLDECHEKDNRYNRASDKTNIVYLTKPRFDQELLTEINRFKTAFDEKCRLARDKCLDGIDTTHWNKDKTSATTNQRAAGSKKSDPSQKRDEKPLYEKDIVERQAILGRNMLGKDDKLPASVADPKEDEENTDYNQPRSKTTSGRGRGAKAASSKRKTAKPDDLGYGKNISKEEPEREET